MKQRNGNGRMTLPETARVAGVEMDKRDLLSMVVKERTVLTQRIARNALRIEQLGSLDAHAFRSRTWRLKPGTDKAAYIRQLENDITQDVALLDGLRTFEAHYELAE